MVDSHGNNGGRGDGRTVLVVEDEFQLRRLIARLLTMEGFRVLQAEHGEAALRVLAAEGVDLILLDYKMPVMDGREFLAAMRPEWPDVPVLMVTASPEANEIRHEFGCAGVVMKPFMAAALLEAAYASAAAAPVAG